MGDPVQSLSKTVHPEVAGPKLQQNPRKHVARELYPAFADIHLEALEEFHGSDWSEALSREWRDTTESAVQLMFEGYDRRAHV